VLPLLLMLLPAWSLERARPHALHPLSWSYPPADLAAPAGLIWQSLPCRFGYQAYLSLFIAPTTYDLADYLAWPETDTIVGQQLAFARVKIHPDFDYTWSGLYSSVNASSKGAGFNARMSQVSRHGGRWQVGTHGGNAGSSKQKSSTMAAGAATPGTSNKSTEGACAAMPAHCPSLLRPSAAVARAC